MYSRGRATGRNNSYRGRGRGQQSNRYIAPKNEQQSIEQRQSRREYLNVQNPLPQRTNIRNRSNQRYEQSQNAQHQENVNPRIRQNNQRSRSVSNFNKRASTFQITERTPNKKIIVPKFDKNQKFVHTCSTTGFEMDLFVSDYSNSKTSDYTVLAYTFMAFFYGNWGPVDGKTLVPAKRKNVQKRDLYETIEFTMGQIVEKFQTMPKMATEEENFSERICTLFDGYSHWCNSHLKHETGYRKVHDVIRNKDWRKNESKNTGEITNKQDTNEQNATESA